MGGKLAFPVQENLTAILNNIGAHHTFWEKYFIDMQDRNSYSSIMKKQYYFKNLIKDGGKPE